MEKINFNDLPNTDTPINSSNLNQLQTNVENGINVVNNKFNYSTEEQVIGTWIDGKPIYRKVVTFETSDNCNITHAHNIVNADKLWINEGASFVYVNDPVNWKQEVVGLNWYYSDNEWTRAWLNFSAIRYRASFNIGVRTAYVVIEYTKTTD